MSNSTNALEIIGEFRDSLFRRIQPNLTFLSVIVLLFYKTSKSPRVKMWFLKIIQKEISNCRAILGHNLLIAYRINLWQRHIYCLCLGMGLNNHGKPRACECSSKGIDFRSFLEYSWQFLRDHLEVNSRLSSEKAWESAAICSSVLCL